MPVGPACRYPDPITHDQVTPCGTTVPLPNGPDPQTTLIEGLAAAHVMHGVICGGATAATPVHPPNPAPAPIAVGSPTVFIGNMPAARWTPSGDLAGCGVFLGTLPASSARTTLIGDGGGAVKPLPVKMIQLFPGGPWVMQIGASIFVQPDPGNPGYQGQVAQAYQRLNQLSPNFRRALAALDATPYTLAVRMYNGAMGPFNATTARLSPIQDVMPAGMLRTVNGTTVMGNGKGSSSVIEWDPNVNGNGIPPGSPGSDQQGSDVIIAHETNHGVTNATAQSDPTTDAGGFRINNERNTTGLPAQVYNGAPGDPRNGTPLPDTTGRPYTENGTRNDYRGAGVNAPYDPVQNPGPPAPAPPRPSYYPAGQPY